MTSAIKLPRAAPQGHIEHMDDADHQERATAEVRKLAYEGYLIDQEIKRLSDRQKEIKNKLSELVQPGFRVVLHGISEASIIEQSTMVFSFDGVKQLLGPRFEDLVKTKVTHSASDQLKRIVNDADHELSAPLRKHVKTKESIRVTFKESS